jgi:hypothetical protein
VNRPQQLKRRIRLLTSIFVAGLVLSGATAIPLETELNAGVSLLGIAESPGGSAVGLYGWLVRVRDALHETNSRYPFIAYGFDWLAFGHFVIAIAFIGALRDPARNVWLFQFGMIACVLVVPYAIVFGGLRGIPICWRLIDCAFGVAGFIPMWLCRRFTGELNELTRTRGISHAS